MNTKMQNYITEGTAVTVRQADVPLNQKTVCTENYKFAKNKPFKLNYYTSKNAYDSKPNSIPSSNNNRDVVFETPEKSYLKWQEYHYRGFQQLGQTQISQKPEQQQPLNTNDRGYKNPKYWAVNYLNNEVTSERDYLSKKNKGELLVAKKSMQNLHNLRNLMDLNQEIGKDAMQPQKPQQISKCNEEDLKSWKGDQHSDTSFTK